MGTVFVRMVAYFVIQICFCVVFVFCLTFSHIVDFLKSTNCCHIVVFR